MFQNNVRLTAAWLFRSLGICGWCLATALAFAQFIDSPALGLELEMLDETVCLNSETCIDAARANCGKSDCKDTVKCKCVDDAEAEMCKCQKS